MARQMKGEPRQTDQRPILTLDAELYQHHLDNSGLSDGQKKELLETLWSVICEFAQMGFGVHPVQQVQEIRGKHAVSSSRDAQDDSLPVGLTHEGLVGAFITAAKTEYHDEEGENADA